jgi:hypothetical protein
VVVVLGILLRLPLLLVVHAARGLMERGIIVWLVV